MQIIPGKLENINDITNSKSKIIQSISYKKINIQKSLIYLQNKNLEYLILYTITPKKIIYLGISLQRNMQKEIRNRKTLKTS